MRRMGRSSPFCDALANAKCCIWNKALPASPKVVHS